MLRGVVPIAPTLREKVILIHKKARFGDLAGDNASP
jgi:hypothetical protein